MLPINLLQLVRFCHHFLNGNVLRDVLSQEFPYECALRLVRLDHGQVRREFRQICVVNRIKYVNY